MPLQTNFDSNLDGYTATASAPATAAWDGATGNPSAGCSKLYSVVAFPDYYGAQIANVPANYQITDNAEKLWFNAKIVSNIDLQSAFTNYIFSVTIDYLSAPFSITYPYVASNLLAANGFNSGWLQFQINLAASGHVAGDWLAGLTFASLPSLAAGSYDGQEITIQFDSVEFSVSQPPFDPLPGEGLIHSSGGIPGLILVTT